MLSHTSMCVLKYIISGKQKVYNYYNNINISVCYSLHVATYRRKAKGDSDILSGGGTRPKQRRPEVGIKIFVPDYRSNLGSS